MQARRMQGQELKDYKQLLFRLTQFFLFSVLKFKQLVNVGHAAHLEPLLNDAFTLMGAESVISTREDETTCVENVDQTNTDISLAC